MNHARGLWKFETILIMSLFTALYFGRPKTEVDDAEETARRERATSEKKSHVAPEDRIALMTLTIPLDCTDASATVKAFKHDHHRSKVIQGCYTRSEK